MATKVNNRLRSKQKSARKRQDTGAPNQGAAVSASEGASNQGAAVSRVLEVYFKPPLAIARVGGSDTPLESFIWAEDPTIHGDRRTTLRPAVTLEVAPDGTALPYFPGAIHFKDGEHLRPVAPFFELWVKRFGVKEDQPGGEGKPEIFDEPLTLKILKELNVPLESVMYRITVANRKAQRRTRRAADAFIARVEAAGNDHERKPLLGISPHNAQQEPLVFAEKPVPLGHFQVIRPTAGKALAVDLSALRVRFTPARGEVYGPPTAVTGPASPLKQGDALDPSTLGGRIYEIVPAENRILNPKSWWCRYVKDRQDQMDPTPSDSYDGANVGNSRSWGVVDDTCDGIIEATIVVAGERFVARSRVLSSCPDFAPDRRPFLSFADNLADRDCAALPPVNDDTIEETWAEVGDLFARVFEFASLVNLDATRNNGILNNDNDGAEEVRGSRLPRVDDGTMTEEETAYAKGKRYADELVPLKKPSLRSPSVAQGQLPYAVVAHDKHRDLANIENLLDAMRSKPERFRHLLRPPYGRFRQLKPKPDRKPNPKFRDARPRTTDEVPRDTVHDMRMPPYMRDSDATALSLTWRQYDEIMQLVKRQQLRKPLRPEQGGAERPESPANLSIVKLLNRLQRAAQSVTSMQSGVPPTTTRQEGNPSAKIFPRNLTARAADWVRGNPVVTRPEDAVTNCFPGLELDERNLDRRFFPGLVFEFVWENEDEQKNGARLAYVDHLEDPDLRADGKATANELYNAIDKAKADDKAQAINELFEEIDKAKATKELYNSIQEATADKAKAANERYNAIENAKAANELLNTIVEDTAAKAKAANELFNAIDDAALDLGAPGTRWFLEAIQQGGGKKVPLAGLDGAVVWRLVRSLEAENVTIWLKRRGRVPRGEQRTYTFTGWRRHFTDKNTGVISAAYQPGELLQSLCSPWQHDFRDCACHYWASNRPDVVYAESPLGETLPGGIALDPVRANKRFDWMRTDRSPERAAGALPTMDENRPFQLDHLQINRAWQSLNVVLGETEIGPLWVPPTPDNANPFLSPKELAEALREILAPIEMALVFEYLYAMLSLRKPEEITPENSGGWPVLKLQEDLQLVRTNLLLTAQSEMKHLRWANEILWQMYLGRLIDGFEPVLVPAYWIPTADKDGNIWKKDRTPVMRKRALRPLTEPNRGADQDGVRDALQDFLAVEHPAGYVDHTYARVVATLRQPQYPQGLVGLAQQILRDGMEHESHFTLIQNILRPYGGATPYLREVNVKTWTEVEQEEKGAHTLFTEILADLNNAYSEAARRQLPDSGRHVTDARDKMQKLLVKAEELAANKVGLPFFEDFPAPKDLTAVNP